MQEQPNTEANAEPTTTEHAPVTSPLAPRVTEPPLTIGRTVLFVENSRPHAAIVCYVNDDRTANLLVFGHEGQTWARTNVKRATIELPDAETVKFCEQRWFWPPRV